MDQEKLIKATKMMIEAFGEDPDREGLRETPGAGGEDVRGNLFLPWMLSARKPSPTTRFSRGRHPGNGGGPRDSLLFDV